MNIVIYRNGQDWLALFCGLWFRAPTREILLADVEHMESRDWGHQSSIS